MSEEGAISFEDLAHSLAVDLGRVTAERDGLTTQLAKVTGERDRARDLAAALEAEMAGKVRMSPSGAVSPWPYGAVTASGWMDVTQ